MRSGYGSKGPGGWRQEPHKGRKKRRGKKEERLTSTMVGEGERLTAKKPT